VNATIKKESSSKGIGKIPLLPLKDIILTNESSVEGLIRGVNALCSRCALDGLFEYDGLVSGATRFNEFLEKRNHIFSASQLETLANCPMLYLFEYIYGLGKIEELGNEASPMDMGEYLHAILSFFFKGLHDQGQNVSDRGLPQSFSEALKIARAYSMKSHFLKRLEFFETQEMELLAGLEQDMDNLKGEPGLREGIFARLLRFEEKAFKNRIPEGVEYEFGYKRDLLQLGKASLRGYIDRFDRDKDNKGMVYIYDYKSGRIPSSNMVKKGLSFQLPVYIRALRSMPGVRDLTASYYSLKKEGLLKDSPLSQTITDHVSGIKGLDLSGVSMIDEYVDLLLNNLERGYFHHSADGIQCSYCDFNYACHRDFRRMDHLLDSGADHHIYSGLKNLESWKRVDKFRRNWKNILASMQKAIELKTESARKRHFETVLKFGKEMADNRDSLPFHDEYIDKLLHEIDEFEKRYQGNKVKGT
jgi:RecB family exonuclease